MPFLINGFSSHQYKAYLQPSSPQQPTGNVSFWGVLFNLSNIPNLAVVINRIAYSLLRGFVLYPNNAYLFQQFKSYEFKKIDNENHFKVAKELFAIFQQCSELDSLALKEVEEKLHVVEKRLQEEELFVDEIFDEDVEAESSERHIMYCDHPEVVGLLEASTYKSAVQQLPIACVDIFLYNSLLKAYLLVYRKNAPAKEMWWMPGGRIYKGESFFEAAQRKCWDEVKVKVIPLAQLGTYSTIFPDSEWGCQTHTINTVVLAILSSENHPEVNLDHADYEWRSLQLPPHPEDLYLNQAYREGISRLQSLEN